MICRTEAGDWEFFQKLKKSKKNQTAFDQGLYRRQVHAWHFSHMINWQYVIFTYN